MPSPFPGMDPYLEGSLWPDVHNSLAYVIKVQLAPRVGETYVVHMNTYTVEDTSPEEDIGILYPDVELKKPIEVRIPVVEIRDKKNNKLITAIEILSPVNKRKPGLQPYREKRLRLHYAGANLLEIDLLRRGERPFEHPYLPRKHYIVSLLRAQGGQTQIWAMDITDPLPVLPVPLRQPDPDTVLDLGQALRDVYEQGFYQKSVNYTELPPPPAFSEAELLRMRELGCLNR
ncbi:MAG: DUF4058 family protein [Saprospiraceae bacterium]